MCVAVWSVNLLQQPLLLSAGALCQKKKPRKVPEKKSITDTYSVHVCVERQGSLYCRFLYI
jgi:hypothetical protein